MKSILFFIVLLLNAPLVSAQKYNLELKGEYEKWATENHTSFRENSTGVLGGIGLGYYGDEYFVGGGYILGDYQFDSDSTKSLQRMDIDLVIGKKIDQQWSVFTGYRFNQFSYEKSDEPSAARKENTLGLGLGASFTVPFTPRWYTFITGVVSGIYAYNNFDETAKGYSLGLEGGVLFVVNAKTTLAMRIKTQGTSLAYDDTVQARDWNHSYVRAGVSLGYAF